jgi:hypothetical protein
MSLNNGQKEKIKELYGEMTMVEFYATFVRIDGVEETSTGFNRGNVNGKSMTVDDSVTTYEDYYKQNYAAFNFPRMSLFENQCLSFCPEPKDTQYGVDVGYASVNGVCLECKSPCMTCKKEVTRCKSCR